MMIGGSRYSAREDFLLSRFLIVCLFDNLAGIIDTASEMRYAPPLIYQRHSTYSDRQLHSLAAYSECGAEKASGKKELVSGSELNYNSVNLDRATRWAST